MKVAFGTTVLAQGIASNKVDGIGNYTNELKKQLSKIDSQLILKDFVFASRGYSEKVIHAGDFKKQAISSLVWGKPFREFSAKVFDQYDLVHCTDHLVPVLSNIPVVATIMDAVPLSHPKWVNYSFKKIKNLAWKKTVQKASHIITISEFSKIEICKHFSINEKDISVVYLGVDEKWFKKPLDLIINKVKERYNLPEKYFLFVGTIQPRKNLSTLITAHKNLPLKVRKEYPLLVVGRAGWDCKKEIEEMSLEDHNYIRWLNYIPEKELHSIVHMAKALICPSLYEGFGLPILEAFASEVPVLASRASAIPEVADDCALLFNPMDKNQISKYLIEVATNQKLCDWLISKGKVRAKKFSWYSTAKLTYEVYKKVLN